MPVKLLIKMHDRSDKAENPELPQRFTIMDILHDSVDFGTWDIETDQIACVRVTDLGYRAALAYSDAIEAVKGDGSLLVDPGNDENWKRKGRTLRRVNRYSLDLDGVAPNVDVRNRVFSIKKAKLIQFLRDDGEALNPDYTGG